MNRSIFTNPYVLTAPAFLLAAFIILWPLFQIGEISLNDVNRFGQLRGFSGFDNFTAVLSDPQFLAACWRTVIWTVGIVAGTILISIPVALILNQDFYGRGIARVIIMLPWAVSLTMTAIVWRWALSGESGMLNSALRGLGLIDENIQWLAQSGTAFPVQIAIGILVSIPLPRRFFSVGCRPFPMICTRPPSSRAPMAGRRSPRSRCRCCAHSSISPWS